MVTTLPAGPGMRARFARAWVLVAVALGWPVVLLAAEVAAVGATVRTDLVLWAVVVHGALSVLGFAVVTGNPTGPALVGVVAGLPAGLFGEAIVGDAAGLPARPWVLALAGSAGAVLVVAATSRVMTRPFARDLVDANRPILVRFRGFRGYLLFERGRLRLTSSLRPQPYDLATTIWHPGFVSAGWRSIVSARAEQARRTSTWTPQPEHEVRVTPGPVLRVLLSDGHEWVVPVPAAVPAAQLVEYARLRRWAFDQEPRGQASRAPVVRHSRRSRAALMRQRAREPIAAALSVVLGTVSLMPGLYPEPTPWQPLGAAFFLVPVGLWIWLRLRGRRVLQEREASSRAAGQVLRTRSSGTPQSAARVQP